MSVKSNHDDLFIAMILSQPNKELMEILKWQLYIAVVFAEMSKIMRTTHRIDQLEKDTNIGV